MATQRILDFLATRRPNGPCLVVDLDVVRDNFRAFEKALPDSKIYYAVKANPAPEILRLLAAMGSSFDTASVAEVEMAMDAGAPADRISFGNTIKKERDIARAYAARHPAVRGRLRRGSREDRPRRSRRARVLPRADRRRGRRMAAVAQVRLRARRWPSTCCAMPRRSASTPMACRSMSARSRPTSTPGTVRSADAKRVFATLADEGIVLKMVNMGGGFPTRYLKDVPAAQAYGQAIFSALRKHFGNDIPETIIEPGRGMVGNAGVIKSEVVLISKKADNDNVRWVYPRHRQVRRSGRDDGRGDPLPDRHGA